MTLREIADRADLRIGVAVGSQVLAEPESVELLTAEFNSVTPENSLKWSQIHPEPDRWETAQADALVDLAEAHDMEVRGHTIVWPHWGTPDYVTECHDPDQLRSYLVDHTTDLLSRYRGRIQRYDVINEPLHWLEGRPAEQVWLETLGPGYLAEALFIAREADPDVELWINETHIDVVSDKHGAFQELIDGVVAAGAPLDGIGLQTHCLAPDFAPKLPEPGTVEAVVAAYAGYGVEIALTELDMLTDPTDPDRLDKQGAYLGELTDAALSVDACRELTFWGLSDRHTWIAEHFGPDRAPLLFDKELQPKPAYDGVALALNNRAKRKARTP